MTIAQLTLQSTFQNEIDTINALIVGIGGIGAGVSPLPGTMPLASSDAHLSPAWLNQDLPTVSGSANAIQLTFARPYVTVQDNAEIVFIPTATNTGAVTITIDATPAATLTRDGSAPLTAGDLVIGQVFRFKKIGTSYRLVDNANSFGSLNVAGSPVVTLTATQTLTNKTLTAPTIATIVNGGTLTLPSATDTLVGRTTTDTLTNKTLTNAKWNDGTAIAPAFSQVSNANIGLYKLPGTGGIGLSTNGLLVGLHNSNSTAAYFGSGYTSIANGLTSIANSSTTVGIVSTGSFPTQVIVTNIGQAGVGSGTGNVSMIVATDTNSSSAATANLTVQSNGNGIASITVVGNNTGEGYLSVTQTLGSVTSKLNGSSVGTTTNSVFSVNVNNNPWLILNPATGFPSSFSTPPYNDNSLKLATTAYADRAVAKSGIELFWPKNGSYMYFSQGFLGSDGNVYSVGFNQSSWFGLANTYHLDTIYELIRASMPFGKKIVKYASQRQGALVLTADNQLYTWGTGGSGSMGDGSTATNYIPTLLTGIPGTISSIHCSRHICQGTADQCAVITSTGRLFVWGYNGRGGFGNGATANILTPIELVNPDSSLGYSYVQLSAHGCFYVGGTQKQLYAAGLNNFGQLGVGDTVNRTSRTLCLTTTGTAVQNVKKIIHSNYSGDFARDVTLVLTSDGILYGCGSGDVGLLGQGNTTSQTRFIQIMSGVQDIQLCCGTGVQGSALALKTDGTLWGWGYNNNGELGLGDSVQRNSPTQIRTNGASGPFITGVASLGEGNMDINCMFLKADGTMWASGNGAYGSLGCGDFTDRNVFIQMLVPEIVTDFYMTTDRNSDVQDVAVYMKTISGKMYVCGANPNGRLGISANGTNTYVSNPLPVQPPKGY